MKLYNAVLMGRFCGLNTVEECINNVERHSMSLFKYTEIAKEISELSLEYIKYLEGNLSLDIDEIDKKNQEEMDNWIAEEDEYRRMHPEEDLDLELDFNK